MAGRAPTCWKEDYEAINVVAAGANQRFTVASAVDYPVNCDALVQLNGVIFDYQDFHFVTSPGNTQIDAYLNIGDYLSFNAITNSTFAYWMPEFYWTVPESGAGQTFTSPTLLPFAGARDITNTNISVNGVILEPLADYDYADTTITFSCYLNANDVVGILPTCVANYAGTPLVPIISLIIANGTRNGFNDNLLSNYTAANQLIISLNGVLMEPTVDYTHNNNRITFAAAKPNNGDVIVVLANSRPC